MKTTNRRINFGLYGSVASVNLLSFMIGNAYCWTSPVLPKLRGDSLENPFGAPVTVMQESWITSLLSLGAAFGPIIGAFTIDRIGRKKTLILISFPMIVAYLIMAFATSPDFFYAARFMLGLGLGCVFSVVPLYVGEISEAHNRGLLSCFMGIINCIGSSMSFMVGPYLSIKLFSLLSVMPLILFLVVFTIFAPESPYYYLLKNQEENARVALQKIRTSDNIEKELQQISLSISDSFKDHVTLEDILKSKAVVKGLIVVFGLMLFQQFCGITIVEAYLQSIFDAAGSTIQSKHSAIMVGVVQLAANITTSCTVDRLGRKVLLLASMFGMCISCASIGLYFYLKISGFDVSSLFWLPTTSMLIYIIAFNWGAGPVAWTMTGELFPPNCKARATAASSIFCLALAFVVTGGFPTVSLIIGMAWSFWTFSFGCFLAFVFVAMIVPETKGKTLREIQDMLGGR